MAYLKSSSNFSTSRSITLTKDSNGNINNYLVNQGQDTSSVGDVTNMFANTKDFKDVTSYKLMRGVPDFGSLVQFNPYESGYAAFVICGMPKFIEALAKYNSDYNKLIKNWQHIVEYEFKSFDGLEDISASTIQLGDDTASIDVINNVEWANQGSEFSLVYDEKSGSPLTKFARLYLTGIKDPKSKVKTYHGLIHNGYMEPGFENEVFTFLFMATDNTMRYIESAYLIIGAQLQSADTSMYNYTKGDINKKEITIKFKGYPIQSRGIDKSAQAMLDYLMSTSAGARQIIVNSDNFDYTGTESIAKTLQGYGVDTKDMGLQETAKATYDLDAFFTSDQTKQSIL